MHRQQVLVHPGTSSIADPLHHRRWDYTAMRRTDRHGNTEIKHLTLWFENDNLTRWKGENFPEDDAALAQEVPRFGPSLPRESSQRRR